MILKINYFRGDLTDLSAHKEALAGSREFLLALADSLLTSSRKCMCT